MKLKPVRFVAKDKGEFIATLRKRVDGYFKENNISKHANANMVLKTIFMLLLYFIPYTMIMAGVFDTWWSGLLGFLIMGFGMAGIGLSIMHDANHEAYSSNKRVNKIMGLTINIVGGHDINWRIQHNVLHHSFTNVDGLDEDINPGNVMRFSPHAPWKKAYKYQHIYAWFLYGFMTASWMTVKDFKQLFRYNKMGMMQSQKTTLGKELAYIIVTKLAYYAYVIALPLIFSELSWWLVLVGVFLMHFTAGLSLALIFQPAHVLESSEFPLPDDKNKIENNWAIHQLETTANFAPDSGFFSWYVGGLNYQIEHHLFPNICHVHYAKLAKIVRATAEEYNLKYNSYPTFVGAVSEHAKMLKKLGQPNYAA